MFPGQLFFFSAIYTDGAHYKAFLKCYSFQKIHHSPKILRQRRLPTHSFPAAGMGEAELPGVQKLAAHQGPFGVKGTIDRLFPRGRKAITLSSLSLSFTR